MSETTPAAAASDALLEGATCAVHRESAATFVCTRCGNFGCAECIFSEIPAREVCRACAAKGLGEPIPWERRSELGKWAAFWSTVSLVTRTPTAFFRTPSVEKGISGAVIHGTATYTLGQAFAYLFYGLLMMVGAGATAFAVDDRDGATIAAFLGIYGCMLAGMSPLTLLFSPASALMGIVVAAAAAHGTLALFKKTNASFEETLRAVSYANAPMVWVWVPVIGFFTKFWMIGIEVIALREAHRCGTDWAFAAAVIYRAVLFLLALLAYAALIGGLLYLDAR